MNYRPKNLTREELLTKAGFTRLPVGWEYLYEHGKKRLHALYRLDEIHLHRDVIKKKKHLADSDHPRVVRMIKKFERIDAWAAPTLWMKLKSFIQVIFH